MVIAVDVFRYKYFIKSNTGMNNSDLECNYTNWREVLEKQILREMNTEDFSICSNNELEEEINQIIRNNFNGKIIPVSYLDRRSAALGHYFTQLSLRDIPEAKNTIFVEINRDYFTGHIYRYHNRVYRPRRIINFSNRGKDITEDIFPALIDDLDEKEDTTWYIVTYDEDCLEYQDKMQEYLSENNYKFKFIPWSQTDGCEGLLKNGILRDKFPQFDHEKIHIETVSLVKDKVDKKVKSHNKPQSIERAVRISHQESNAQMKFYKIPKSINQYPSRNFVMGIDFGTTKCSVAVSRNSQIEVVQDNVGHRSFKSFISFDQSVPVIGNVAFKRLRDKSEYLIYDIKKIIGKKKVQFIERDDSWPFQVRDSENGVEIVTKTSSGEKRFNPTELTAILFKQLKEITSEFQQAYNNGEEIKEAVITVPSFYDNIQREAIKEAAESAGIKVLDL
ncbi:hypothetical protein FO519_009932, partial [Halicephalobus sp. NKZ332]